MRKINLMSIVINEALNSQGLLAWPAPVQGKLKGVGSQVMPGLNVSWFVFWMGPSTEPKVENPLPFSGPGT